MILLSKEVVDEKGDLSYKYPVLYNYHSNPEDEWNEFRHIYNFEDICSKNYSDCEWVWHNNSMEIYFNSKSDIDPGIENVTTCKTLNTRYGDYQLTQNLTGNGDCIIIAEDFITFDLNGYTIKDYTDLSTKYAVYLAGSGSGDYVTVKNGYIYNYSRGILGRHWTTISNMSISSCQRGIITGNNGNSLSDITTSNNSMYAVYFNYAGTLTRFSSNNDEVGLWAYGYNVDVRDSIISNGVDKDIKVQGTNVELINVIYSTEEFVEGGTLFRKWYYKAYVNDTSGNPVNNTNVSIYNSTGDFQTSLLTGADGYTSVYEITDYFDNGTKTYYSNYAIYADKPCYPSYRTYYNVTEQENNLKHVLTLGSSTYQAWNWNFADNCNLTDISFNVQNITSSGSGTWIINKTNITCTDFDMNSSGNWEIIGSKIRVIGS